MKKILLSAAMMVAAVSFASAQWFAGGNLGFESSKKEFVSLNVDGLLDALDLGIGIGGDLDLPLGGMELKTTSYTIIPKVGYIFNENWMVGLGVGYTNTENKVSMEGGDGEIKLTSNMFTANPYVRYTAWQVGRFSLAFQGDVNVGFGDLKMPDLVGGTGEEVKYKKMQYGVNIAPVVQFDLSCNVMLESKFNFASLGYNYKEVKVGDAKSKNSGFNFGANSNEAFTTGDIEVGFIVKF